MGFIHQVQALVYGRVASWTHFIAPDSLPLFPYSSIVRKECVRNGREKYVWSLELFSVSTAVLDFQSCAACGFLWPAFHER